MSFYLERVGRGVDYIESRLDQPLALADVARAAGLSQWHFQRMFKSLTGETVMTYIRARRLAGALDRLANTDLRVLDVAIMAGFSSQEAFAKAFKRSFGISPRQYRRFGSGGRFLRRLRIDEGYLQHLDGGMSREPELIEQPPMTLVGLRTELYGRDSDKDNVGEKLPALWDAFLTALGTPPEDGLCYGVVAQEAPDSEGLVYHAAVELRGPVPAGMSTVRVPGAVRARFAHQGHAAAVDRTVSYAYGAWLMQSGWRHTGAPDLEVYGSRYHATREDSLFHYTLPVEPV